MLAFRDNFGEKIRIQTTDKAAGDSTEAWRVLEVLRLALADGVTREDAIKLRKELYQMNSSNSEVNKKVDKKQSKKSDEKLSKKLDKKRDRQNEKVEERERGKVSESGKKAKQAKHEDTVATESQKGLKKTAPKRPLPKEKPASIASSSSSSSSSGSDDEDDSDDSDSEERDVKEVIGESLPSLGCVAAKMSVRTGLRCYCHYLTTCPDRTKTLP